MAATMRRPGGQLHRRAPAASDGGVILINLESPARTFDNALPAFQSFAASVKG